MKNAAALREQIEVSLSARMPGALTPPAKLTPELTPCGVEAIDRLLHGGLPEGAITELVGMECSGRTTMALAYVAAITHAGGVCAWVDVADCLAPESAAASGVDLERLLWVRCGADRQTAASDLKEQSAQPEVPLAAKAAPEPRHTGGGSPHPRSEGRDMPEAVGALLLAHGGLSNHPTRQEKKHIGTPGAPNRSLSTYPKEREEQVNSDRLPARRGDNLSIAPSGAPQLRCAEPQRRQSANLALREPSHCPKFGLVPTRPWQALDQALRATDLLLQGGGFRTIVLDLASVSPEVVWRIPLATWFRFRAACDRSRISLLLLTQHACARSSAELVVRLEAGSFEAQNKVMTGIRYRAAVERDRKHGSSARVVSIRKPPEPERAGTWRGEAPWARVV